jgi:exopolysaccharide biosynthesis polyprenyl glycosylphosphotransferase
MNQFLRRNWRIIYILISILADIVVYTISGIAAWGVLKKFIDPSFCWREVYSAMSYAGTIILVSGAVNGLYRGTFRLNQLQLYALAAKSYLWSVLINLALLFFFRLNEADRDFILLFLLFIPPFFIFSRSLLDGFLRVFRKRGLGIHNVLIIGDEESWRNMLERSKIFPELGYNVVGLIVWDREETHKNVQLLKMYENLPVYPFSFLKNVIEVGNVERIFLSTSRIFEQEDGGILAVCQEYHIKLKVVTRDAEDMLRFSCIRDISGLPLYSPERGKIEIGKQIVKRIFDILFSIAAIVLLCPLLLIVACLIYAEDHGPILYKQKRALAKGKGEFFFYKFRSMVPHADKTQEEFYKYNETTGGLFMMENDPRVTKIGKIIRKYSIDELPQLFNVLKGDMSIVGPRPLPLADINNITTANSMRGYYTLRANAKPGITGLWQISGRREVQFREMVLLDLYYIENQSILFDMEIILETIPVVFFGKGAY